MKNEISINANQMASSLTLKIRIEGLKLFRFRVWLGSKVLILGAAIIGCGIQIHDQKK